MENATDALYIGFAMLIFVVALSICISSFSTQISKIDEIVLADERLDTATRVNAAGETEFMNYISYSETSREVGVETIVNTLYRSYKENYMVYLKLNNYSSFRSVSGVRIITLNKEQKYNGNVIIPNGAEVIEFKITTEYNLQNAKDKLNEILGNGGLYNYLLGKNFKEYIGELYQNDIGGAPTGVSDANKTKIRIITYVEE